VFFLTWVDYFDTSSIRGSAYMQPAVQPLTFACQHIMGNCSCNFRYFALLRM